MSLLMQMMVYVVYLQEQAWSIFIKKNASYNYLINEIIKRSNRFDKSVHVPDHLKCVFRYNVQWISVKFFYLFNSTFKRYLLWFYVRSQFQRSIKNTGFAHELYDRKRNLQWAYRIISYFISFYIYVNCTKCTINVQLNCTSTCSRKTWAFNTIGILLYRATALTVFKSQLINGQRQSDLRNSNTLNTEWFTLCDYAIKKRNNAIFDVGLIITRHLCTHLWLCFIAKTFFIIVSDFM